MCYEKRDPEQARACFERDQKKLTYQEAYDLYMAVRYNLPNSKLKEAVDIAFEVLGEKLEEQT